MGFEQWTLGEGIDRYTNSANTIALLKITDIFIQDFFHPKRKKSFVQESSKQKVKKS